MAGGCRPHASARHCAGDDERTAAPADFLRTHRTAIVRRSEVRELVSVSEGAWLLRLRSGAAVPVSPRYLEQVRAQLAVGAV